MECVVHYPESESTYSILKTLSANQHAKLLQAKSLREKEVLDTNRHLLQCRGVPEEGQLQSTHGVHLTPCYKKIVSITKPSRKRVQPEKTATRLKRVKLSDSTSGIFPKTCFSCGLTRKRKAKVCYNAFTITTLSACQKLKAAAIKRDDQERIIQFDAYSPDDSKYLIDKELQMHKDCYRDYVRCLLDKNQNVDNDSKPPEKTKPRDRFLNVKTYIQETILLSNRAISMDVLLHMYDENSSRNKNAKVRRSQLKTKIIEEFGDKLTFLDNDNSPQIVVSTEGLNSLTIMKDKDSVISQAAKYIRKDVQDYANNFELPWPPAPDSLKAQEDNIPESVRNFFTYLLKSKDTNTIDDPVKRLIMSFSSDLIHGVTKGKVMTLKHFLLAMGLHNITGLKAPINILSHLGHCINYNLVCEVETAQAEVAMKCLEEGSTNMLNKSLTTNDVKVVYWWADNFNQNIETQTGHGVIDSTHIVEFSESIIKNEPMIASIPRSNRRSLSLEQMKLKTVKINKKREPHQKSPSNTCSPPKRDCSSDFIKVHLRWFLNRFLTSRDQIFPVFSGWDIINEHAESIEKTHLNYLPPINAPITEFNTIYKLFELLQERAVHLKSSYVNITFDVGAIINAYRVLWNYPDQFKNIILHLGDFHLMKEVFKLIGQLICGSGFEDIVFQASICSTGSLNGVLIGSHYNRGWLVHGIISEAIERLLFSYYLECSNVPDCIKLFLEKPLPQHPDNESILSHPEVKDFLNGYQSFKMDVRNGKYGKTAQFWVKYYLDIINDLYMLRYSISTNNFDMRVTAIKKIVPLCFALNKQNYARYGSVYVNTLETIEECYPGCKEILEKKGISVQAQERYHHRVPIDQRGEQTINRDAKTSGGIKFFVSDENSVHKWTLNRPAQALNTQELYNIASVRNSGDTYKSIRPSEIVKSEERVQAVMNVFNNEYINPFDPNLPKEKLFNVSSGIPVSKELETSILGVKERGEQKYNEFVSQRIESSTIPIHDPIKREKMNLFKDTSKKVVLNYDNKTQTVDVNRNVLAKLLACSAKFQRPIDFKYALSFPLAPVPLSLAHADGSRRTNKKSDIMNVVNTYVNTYTPIPNNEDKAYMIDLMALIRTITPIPETYSQLADIVFNQLPRGYSRIDIIADSYKDNSIKGAEREKRGISNIVLISSARSKIPRNFSDFLKNGQNKRKLIELVKNELITKKTNIIEMLDCTDIYFSTEYECVKVSADGVQIVQELSSNQEEADTKLLLHTKHSLDEKPERFVIVRSPSGDVDINVLFISLFKTNRENIWIDYNTGNCRKVLRLSDIDMDEPKKNALIGFHALTGNDYVSSFLRRGKLTCWKLLERHNKFVDLFAKLGDYWLLDDDILICLEEFICLLYGSKSKDINDVRYEKFKSSYEKKDKICDLSILPPCRSVCHLHFRRSNYISKSWKSSFSAHIDFPDIKNHGWNDDGTIVWTTQIFPADIIDILHEDISDDEYVIDSEGESEDDI